MDKPEKSEENEGWRRIINTEQVTVVFSEVRNTVIIQSINTHTNTQYIIYTILKVQKKTKGCNEGFRVHTGTSG